MLMGGSIRLNCTQFSLAISYGCLLHIFKIKRISKTTYLIIGPDQSGMST